MRISLAHSPDSDDAFMFFGLARGHVASGDLHIEHVLTDIETLNREAMQGRHEVTAISFHAYPYVADRYALMPCGGSIGDGYGPLLVAREPLAAERVRDLEVAVPGTLTSAYLALQLFAPGVRTRVVPFDRILGEVKDGRSDVGLIIHEGQLTFGGLHLHKVLDLGVWWKAETGLPLPLGGNVVRKDLGRDTIATISDLLRRSIEHGLAHRDAALTYAMDFGRGLERARADRFVGMYVNEWTRDWGPAGRRAIEMFLERGHRAGMIPHRVEVEFAA